MADCDLAPLKVEGFVLERPQRAAGVLPKVRYLVGTRLLTLTVVLADEVVVDVDHGHANTFKAAMMIIPQMAKLI
jgi:hypothetical protein